MSTVSSAYSKQLLSMVIIIHFKEGVDGDVAVGQPTKV